MAETAFYYLSKYFYSDRLGIIKQLIASEPINTAPNRYEYFFKNIRGIIHIDPEYEEINYASIIISDAEKTSAWWDPEGIYKIHVFQENINHIYSCNEYITFPQKKFYQNVNKKMTLAQFENLNQKNNGIK